MTESISPNRGAVDASRTFAQDPADPASQLDSNAWRETLTTAEAWELVRDRMQLFDKACKACGWFDEPEPGSPLAVFMDGGDPPPGWDLLHLLNHWTVGLGALMPPDPTAADLIDHWGMGR